MPLKTITIVSPCFNEEDNILVCYETIKKLFDIHLSEYKREHIFADNASTDNSVEILRTIAKIDSNVKVILNARNFGLFRSTFNALRYSTGDATLVMLPVDLQDPPELIPEMVKFWEDGYDVVAGIRREREENAIMRFFRRIFYKLVNKFSEFEIPENVGDFQLIDKKVLMAALQFNDHYPYIRGIIAACGFKRKLIKYVWKKRKFGKSKIPSFELLDQALNGILSFTNVPIRFCLIAGFILSFLCFSYAVISLGMYFVSPKNQPPGMASLVVGLFFLFSVQLIFIGILGEYISSIHSQVRHGLKVIELDKLNI